MQEDIIIQISNRLKEVRTQKNVTLQELADRVGVTKGLISQIENSRTIPSLPVLMNIIRELKLDLNGFFDAIAFRDAKHGIVLGDPIADESGKLKFEVLETEDGQNWRQLASAAMPEALQGEGAFAASNSSLVILRDPGDRNLWFATGGKVARVFHSPDRGQNWQVFDTPILHSEDSTGIFSIAFRDALHGVIAGGDYKKPKKDGPNLAFTEDGGKTWKIASITPQAYFSAVAYDQRVNQAAAQQKAAEQASEANGKKIRVKPIAPERLFIVGEDFIFDFELPNNPHRIGGSKKQGYGFNAVSAYPKGGGLVVGGKGTIAFIP